MGMIRQVPLYRFLKFCNESGLEKKVLDCGAGGDCPPLLLFAEYGYETHGIEFSAEQCELARQAAKQHGQTLQIEQGDMRRLPFADGSFPIVYSYNSVFHMTKAEVAQSIQEMKRVLQPGGLLFVNFLTAKDFRCGTGEAVGENQYKQLDDGVPVIHSYFAQKEPEAYFADMTMLYKEDRVPERIFEGKWIWQGFVDYILKK